MNQLRRCLLRERTLTLAVQDHLRAACPPGSPSRDVPSLSTFNGSIDDLFPKKPVAAYTYRGFVRNFTASRDACLQPHLRGMHGTFIESISMSTLHDLFPMFGGYKLEQNNEIVIPAGMYLTDREFYSGGKGIGGAVSVLRSAATPYPLLFISCGPSFCNYY